MTELTQELTALTESPPELPAIIQVDRTFKAKNRKHGYTDIQYDYDGWADAKRFLPRELDLCSLRTENNKTVNGWFSNHQWDGLRLRDDDKVLYWKPMMETF